MASGRGLSAAEAPLDETLHHRVADDAKGVPRRHQPRRRRGLQDSVGAIPMLVLALVVVMALRASGGIDALTALLALLLRAFELDPALILLTLTKYIAGGTAMMGVMDEMLKAGTTTVAT